jgi:hypothetical protein
MLLPLPSWVSTKGVNVTVDPFKEILEQMEEMLRNARIVDPNQALF